MKNNVWFEKYRPKTIDECVLPDRIKDIFKRFVSDGELTQHLLLAGPAGCGKTTVARALCKELNADLLFINASLDRNIDTLRTKISGFASSVSLGGKSKVVILDEADYSNSQSFQPALRAFMEEFSSNCKFILTCNYKNKLIQPIHSRCSVIEFNYTEDEDIKMMAGFFMAIRKILDTEKVKYDAKVLAEFVKKFYPDFRRSINELQRYSVNGVIDTGILATIGDVQIADLIGFLKEKKFNDMRQWISQNSDLDTAAILRSLYDSLYDSMEKKSIPQAILIINEAQKSAAFVADPEINLVACCIEIMMSCEFV